ncbi:hypothetical protein HJC23_009245 [Cyclotella cryptica]|uniref:2Fe-2S ferredoxin-type domain-containing protein n=1 Tax=Cyclotella cryptica TaxID=29204 RepID=A0ABD3Q695_9STRA
MAMFTSRGSLHGLAVVALLCGLMFTSTMAFVVSNNSGKSSTSSSLHMTLLTAGGKKIDVPAGSSLKAACAKLGVKPRYSCQKGDCGSCTVSVGGSRIKACVGKVPPQPTLKSLQEKGLEVK